MDFNNSNVRRQDRLLDEESAISLLKSGEYGVLSMQGETGGGYGIPINFVWDGKSSIYFHCAREGRKLKIIGLCDKVSFCVVGITNVVSEKFSTEYESIVLSGNVSIVSDNEERMEALMLLVKKYSPGLEEKGEEYAEGSFERTEVIRMDITEWSGKTKKYK